MSNFKILKFFSSIKKIIHHHKKKNKSYETKISINSDNISIELKEFMIRYKLNNIKSKTGLLSKILALPLEK